MSCCSGASGSGAFFSGGRWHEVECDEGKMMRLAEEMSWPNPYEPREYQPMTPTSCECGSDKTYGNSITTPHSNYCPKSRNRR